MNVSRRNESDHIRRNPQDSQGKLRAGGGDIIGDEDEQVEEWDELIAEEQGRYASRIDEVGNSQDALLGGTGDLDNARDLRKRDTEDDEESPSN